MGALFFLGGARSSGEEIGYAERTANFTTTNTSYGSTAASSKIGGLVLNLTGAGLPVDVEFYAPLARHSVAGTAVSAYLLINGAVTGGLLTTTSSPNTPSGRLLLVKRRLVLVAGTAYTFEIGITGGVAGTCTLDMGADWPGYLSAIAR